MSLLLLNVGCGPQTPATWTNVDREPGPGVQVVCDVLDGLPWEDDGQFDHAVAHHVLQMVAQPDLGRWLGEVRRVVGPGGTLRVSVPDLTGAQWAHSRREADWFPIADAVESSLDGKYCVYITQAGATRSVFTADYLLEVLRRAGFAEARRTVYQETWSDCPQICELDSRPHESIYAEAVVGQ